MLLKTWTQLFDAIVEKSGLLTATSVLSGSAEITSGRVSKSTYPERCRSTLKHAPWRSARSTRMCGSWDAGLRPPEPGPRSGADMFVPQGRESGMQERRISLWGECTRGALLFST